LQVVWFADARSANQSLSFKGRHSRLTSEMRKCK